MNRRTALVLLSMTALVAIGAENVRAQCTTWGPGHLGDSGLDGLVRSSVVWDDGSGPALFVGGEFTTAGAVMARCVAKWNGAHWSALGEGIPGNPDPYDMEPFTIGALTTFDDGSGSALYVAGLFASAGGVAVSNVARWDGVQWSSVGSGLPERVDALCVFDAGSGAELYAALFDVGSPNVYRWNGSTWTAVPGAPTDLCSALAVYDDGSGPALYVGGRFNVPGAGVAKWDGSTWSTLGAGVGGLGAWVKALRVHDDGSGSKLFVGGRFTTAGGQPAEKIARWDGANWTSVGGGFGSSQVIEVCAMEPEGGGSPILYVGGYFTSPGRNIAMWNGSTWSTLGSGVPTVAGPCCIPAVFTLTKFDDGAGDTLFVGGENAQHILRWNGSWSDVKEHAGLNGGIAELLSFDDGAGAKLYAGGGFTHYDSTVLNRIARWNGSSWEPVGAGFGSSVGTLVVYDDGTGGGPQLYAGGSFLTAEGAPAPGIAKWDGSSWSAVGGGVSSTSGSMTVRSLVVHDDGSGPALYVGGHFDRAGAIAVSNIARWDGANWSSVGAGLSGQIPFPALYPSGVNALLVHDDGGGARLYAGGVFTQSGTSSVRYVARWDGATWSQVGTGSAGCNNFVGVTCSVVVNALAEFDDGSGNGLELYVGGLFTYFGGGNNARNVAKWNGTQWRSTSVITCGTCFNYWVCDDPVEVLMPYDDLSGSGPMLLAGGSFCPRGLIAYQDRAWHVFDGGTNGIVLAAAVHDDGTDGVPDLWIGGIFTSVGDLPSAYIARRATCTGVPGAPSCFGDGSLATPCPCTPPDVVPNPSGGPDAGCANAFHLDGARLGAGGTTNPDSVILRAEHLPPSAFVTFFAGDARTSSGIASGDGVRCVSGALVRFGAQSAIHGVVRYPHAAGDLPLSKRCGTPVGSGLTAHYQVVYRNATAGFCTPATLNVSNAYTITWN